MGDDEPPAIALEDKPAGAFAFVVVEDLDWHIARLVETKPDDVNLVVGKIEAIRTGWEAELATVGQWSGPMESRSSHLT